MVEISDKWVEFSFFRPHAQHVSVAGDFNDWRIGELPMTRSENGYWCARMRLPAGEFRFKYCADGQWFADYSAFGVEPGEFGMQSVLRVPAALLKLNQIDSQRDSIAAAA